jgi:hypothetical protein
LPIILHHHFNKFHYKLFDLIGIAQYSYNPEKENLQPVKRASLFLGWMENHEISSLLSVTFLGKDWDNQKIKSLS